MSDLTIRNATSADEAAVINLWQACGLVTNYNDPAVDFRFALAKTSSDILVGVDAEVGIVGTVMVGHDGHRGWIYYVASSPEHRKKGIGGKMVEVAEQWLKDRSVVKVMLLVRETNTQVVDFYTHVGFEVVPRVVMQKWLNADQVLLPKSTELA
jgi:ribosomal protein S18 acetylase RimI-like enzyme